MKEETLGIVHRALKLRHHRHTGRPLEHHHTSYRALFVVLAVAGLSMASIQYARADSYGVTASVPGANLTNAAVISVPADASTSSVRDVTFQGICQVVNTGTVVTLMRSGTSVGSGLCAADSTFSIVVTLLEGSNVITPTVATGLGASGPDGVAVTVTYTPPPVVVPPTSGGVVTPAVVVPNNSTPAQEPLLVIQPVQADGTFATFPTGNATEIQFMLMNGDSPFTIVTDWGDGQIETLQQASAGLRITLRHVYASVGAHSVSVHVQDVKGQKAELQFVVLTSTAFTLAAPSAKIVVPQPDAGLWLKSTRLVWTGYGLLCMTVIAIWFASPTHSLLGFQQLAPQLVRPLSVTRRGKTGRRP